MKKESSYNVCMKVNLKNYPSKLQSWGIEGAIKFSTVNIKLYTARLLKIRFPLC